MGLKCSILGHTFEPAGEQREREERGSEVVTVIQEIERCRECGETNVVSESTEVTAVVDVGEEEESIPSKESSTEARSDGDPATGFESIIERSEDSGRDVESSAADPEDEDAEILTDETTREPGEWPEESADDVDKTAAPPASAESEDSSPKDADRGSDPDLDSIIESEPILSPPDEEALSGITVPEGEIACESCSFRVTAESSYREGDPCPECGSWLTAERDE
ncbi:MAG: hypothetical protein ACLFNI_10370 [Natronomonas sp.]